MAVPSCSVRVTFRCSWRYTLYPTSMWLRRLWTQSQIASFWGSTLRLRYDASDVGVVYSCVQRCGCCYVAKGVHWVLVMKLKLGLVRELTSLTVLFCVGRDSHETEGKAHVLILKGGLHMSHPLCLCIHRYCLSPFCRWAGWPGFGCSLSQRSVFLSKQTVFLFSQLRRAWTTSITTVGRHWQLHFHIIMVRARTEVYVKGKCCQFPV